MAVAYAHARQFVGRQVVAVTRDGRKYYGIVHHVTPTHVYLRPMRPPYNGYVRPMQGGEKKAHVETLGSYNPHVHAPTIEETRWWWPGTEAAIIALPLYALLALGLFWV
ncbi:MAG: hypothetical protein IMX04_03160 [Candidatus Carbobacillus altaicus]|nr:hypothetical protein [Candidatus Carbobacillus altaicus]